MLIHALIALLLAGQAPPAAETDREMLRAFRSACNRVDDFEPCNRVDDFERIRADVLAGGWEEIAESADPRVERLNSVGRELLAEEGDEMRSANFRSRLGDRLIFLIASHASGPDGQWGNSCHPYHFEAEEAIAPATLEAWMGRPPTGVDDLPGMTASRSGQPAWRDGVEVDVVRVRPGTEAFERFGVGGNVLVANFIGGN